jgi:hypothetical protein
VTKNATKRVLTVLESPLFNQVSRIAKRDGLSLSQKVRDLVRDAVERDEDADLTTVVESRMKAGGRWITHDAFWRKVGVK